MGQGEYNSKNIRKQIRNGVMKAPILSECRLCLFIPNYLTYRLQRALDMVTQLNVKRPVALNLINLHHFLSSCTVDVCQLFSDFLFPDFIKEEFANKFLSSLTILLLKGICEVLWWFSTLIFYNQVLTCFYLFYTRLISCLN